jgi:hypothetical protein
VREAVLAQRAIVESMPQATASRCFRILAARLAGLPPADGPGPKTLVPRTPFSRYASTDARSLQLPFYSVEVPPCA